ncbi:MAG: hypothetical protein AAGF73_09850 [Actinomycetota bacterium]
MFAALVQGPIVRLVPVGVLLLALQRTIFVDVRIDGVIIPIMTIAAAATGVAGGSEGGAIAGFVFGLMFDLVEGTPLGSTAAALTVGGAVAGLLALIAADPQWWLAALFTAAGTAAGVVMVPVVRIFIGASEPFETRLGDIVAISAAAGAILSPLLVPVGRWCLRIKKTEWKGAANESAPTV